jgi:hypothetical protein
MPLRVRQVEQTAILQVNLKANTPANSVQYASVLLDPALGAVQQFQIPPNEAWVLEDLYVKDAPAVDVILTFRKNLTEDVMKTAPLSALVVSNPARPKISKQVYEGNTILTIVAQNLSAVGGSDVTVTAFLKIRRFIAE